MIKQLIDGFCTSFYSWLVKTQKVSERVVPEDPFWIVYRRDKFKTQRICDKAVDDSLAAMKLIPDWFVTSKMIKKLYTALYADENILYFNEDSGNVVFSGNEMGISNILNIIILMKMILILSFILNFWLGILNLKNLNHFKKS